MKNLPHFEINFSVYLQGCDDKSDAESEKIHKQNMDDIRCVCESISKLFREDFALCKNDFFVIELNGEKRVEINKSKQRVEDRFLEFIKRELESDEVVYGWGEKDSFEIKINVTQWDCSVQVGDDENYIEGASRYDLH